MKCDNCGNKEAFVWRRDSSGECCDRCAGLRPPWMPSVYFRKEYIDPNLGHYKRPWEKDGVVVTSKRHKAMLMREQGLVESGDRVRGGRNFDKAMAKSARKQGHNPGDVPI